MTLSSVEIAAVALFVLFGGALLGITVGRRLPSHHLAAETKAAVSLSMAVVGTMSALVISLLISNASASFTARNTEVARLSADLVRLDSLLRRYGPQADAARAALRGYADAKAEDLFPSAPDARARVDNAQTVKRLEVVEDLVLALKPEDDRQRWLAEEGLQLLIGIGEARAALVEQNLTSLPLPFLAAVVLWLTLLFASFGLFAPRNVTVIVALFLCAFAVSSAIKLILDMDTPFEGDIRFARPPIRVFGEPLRNAAGAIGR